MQRYILNTETLRYRGFHLAKLSVPLCLCVLLSCALPSCLPENLLIEVAPAEPQLVIASQVLPGNILAVFVTRSFSALEGNEDTLSSDFAEKILVEQAAVQVSINGQIDTLVKLEGAPGIYLSGFGLEFEQAEVRLDVYDSLTDQSVYAITSALLRIELDSVAFFEERIGNDTLQSLYYGFSDPSDIDNWYVLNAFDPAAYAAAISDNPLSLIGEDNGIFYEALWSDQVFEEDRFETIIPLETPVFSDTIAVLFANISEGYFRFLDARQRSNGIIASATSEPINFPSNVVGGLGYFTIQNPSLVLVEKR